MMSKIDEMFTPEEQEQLRKDPGMRALFSDVSDGSFPESPEKDNLLKFFRDLLDFKNESDYDKISKTGNLKDFELGGIKLSVRDYLSIGYYAETENLSEVAGYLRSNSNIIVNTSLSRSAKLLNLLVTRRSLSGVLEPKKTETKKGLFGERTVESGGLE